MPNPGEPGFDDSKPKSYVLEMLPYPSGEPHVGHLKNYAIGDAIAHFRRRNGFQVIHPMGYDAFGLPAENNAIKTGEHPREATEALDRRLQRAVPRLGHLDRLVARARHPRARLLPLDAVDLPAAFERGLAYRTEAPVHWCPNDQTVLANEQVIDGHCERCGTLVESRQLEQWFFRITDYADRLLADFDLLESWPEHVITMQRNWIGRSEGAEVIFRCEELGIDFPVFTTRPTRSSARPSSSSRPSTPTSSGWPRAPRTRSEVRDYVERRDPRVGRPSAATRSARRPACRSGRTVINPVNGEQIPIFVADYVLMEYGTGAIMAVPGHDQRDYDSRRPSASRSARDRAARTARTPRTTASSTYRATAPMVNSGASTAMHNREAYERDRRLARRRRAGASRAVNYRLRDWLVSRQRYWGARSRSSTASSAGWSRCPRTSSRCCCPTSRTTRRRGRARWRRPRTG